MVSMEAQKIGYVTHVVMIVNNVLITFLGTKVTIVQSVNLLDMYIMDIVPMSVMLILEEEVSSTWKFLIIIV